MTFQNGLQILGGAPISQSKYIYGSIFHLMLAGVEGEAELVCNGCQWAVIRRDGEVLLHDEAALSSEALSRVFTGKRFRFAETTPSSVTLNFDEVVLCGFATEDYHLILHDGIALGTPEWRAITDAARDSFMLFSPDQEAVGYEFSEYFDLNSVPWGAIYRSAQEAGLG